MGLPWFKCYPSDLLGSYSWQMMSAAERGAYWHLICLQMNSPDGMIHEDLDRLSALCGHRIEVGSLLERSFPVVSPGRRANLRAAEEYQKRDNKIETNKANGALGGRPKKNPKITHDITHDKTDPDPDPDPDLRAQKPEKDPLVLSQAKSTTDHRFDIFWNAWPAGHKKSRRAAEKAFKTAIKRAGDVQVMVDALEAQKGADKWREDNGRYIPLPSRWLNEDRWEDDTVIPEREYVPGDLPF